MSRQEYRVITLTLAAGEERRPFNAGCQSVLILSATAGAVLQIAEVFDGKQCSFAVLPFGVTVNFTTDRGLAFRNPGSASATYQIAIADAPMDDQRLQNQDGTPEPFQAAVININGPVVNSVNGVLNANLIDGSANFYDVSAHVGKYILIGIVTSAGLVGGNISLLGSIDTTLEPAGLSWPLQDEQISTDTVTNTIVTSAASSYRRIGQIRTPLIKVNLTSAITAGTIQIKIYISNVPFNHTTVNVRNGNGNNFQIVGTAAHSAARAGNAVAVASRAKSTQDTTYVDNDTVDLISDPSNGGLVVKPFGVSGLDWSYAPPVGGIVNSAVAVAARAAGAAGIRNFVVSAQLSWDTLGGATEFVILDGATVLWRHKLQTASGQIAVEFSTPLRGTAATALNIQTVTAVTGGVYCNLQGYQAAG